MLDLQQGNPFKAGLEGNKQEIATKIDQLSRGSKFYQNQERKEKQVQERISLLLDKLNRLSPAQLEQNAQITSEILQDLKASRDLSKIIVHVDMDAFYCAVEELDGPSLKDHPMAVGSSSMLCTANYAARKFGVRSAMPGFIARELCPTLKIIHPRFEKYKEASLRFQEVLKRFDPKFDMMSLDEAYLDITEYAALNGGDPNLIVEKMRREVIAETRLTMSAGIAPNRLIAKICSDINKPNGQFIVEPNEDAIMEFISKISVRKVPGIGKVTEKILNALGIEFCSDILLERAKIYALFSHTTSDFLLRVSIGIGSTVVGLDWNRKSMSVERTFEATEDKNILFETIMELSNDLSHDLQTSNLKARTITLKIKTDDFQIRTRSKTIGKFTNTQRDLFNYSFALLEAELPLKIRLLGIRASSFGGEKEKEVNIEKYIIRAPEIDENAKLEFTCPICNSFVVEAAKRQDNARLNQHIDLCLNQTTLRDFESSSSKLSKNENSTILDLTCDDYNSTKKTKYEQGIESSSNKRKSTEREMMERFIRMSKK